MVNHSLKLGTLGKTVWGGSIFNYALRMFSLRCLWSSQGGLPSVQVAIWFRSSKEWCGLERSIWIDVVFEDPQNRCGLKSPGEISQERAWSGERRDPRAKSGGLSTVQDAAEEGGICMTLTVNASLNLYPKHFTCLHLVPSLLAREEWCESGVTSWKPGNFFLRSDGHRCWILLREQTGWTWNKLFGLICVLREREWQICCSSPPLGPSLFIDPCLMLCSFFTPDGLHPSL